MPLCGDDEGAVDVVCGLVRDLGCVPMTGGGLERAGQLEAVAAFAVGLYARGADPASMFPPLEAAFGGRAGLPNDFRDIRSCRPGE